MADITLNPIALLKTVVVITAGVAVGYLIAHKDATGTAERRAAVVERVEAEQQARQLEAERLELLPPEERQRAQQVQLWGEERVQRMEQEQAERRAGWETRTFGEALADRIPAPAEPERAGEQARNLSQRHNLNGGLCHSTQWALNANGRQLKRQENSGKTPARNSLATNPMHG